jgi:hypothetical protein
MRRESGFGQTDSTPERQLLISIVERNAVPGLIDAQKAQLDLWLFEHATNPDHVVPSSDVKNSALARIRR